MIINIELKSHLYIILLNILNKTMLVKIIYIGNLQY